MASLVHSIKLELCPPHLMCFNWFSSLRTRNSLLLPKCNSSTLLRSPLFIAYSVWLTLPREVKDLTSLRPLFTTTCIAHHPHVLCVSVFFTVFFDIIFLYGVVVAVRFATLSFFFPPLISINFIAVVGNHPLS